MSTLSDSSSSPIVFKFGIEVNVMVQSKTPIGKMVSAESSLPW